MSGVTRAARDLLGMPVYSEAEGKRLGQIASLHVRRQDRALAYVGVSGGGHRHAPHLAFEQLKRVGTDSVMVESEAILDSGPSAEVLREVDHALPGRPVLTECALRRIRVQ